MIRREAGIKVFFSFIVEAFNDEKLAAQSSRPFLMQ